MIKKIFTENPFAFTMFSVQKNKSDKKQQKNILYIFRKGKEMVNYSKTIFVFLSFFAAYPHYSICADFCNYFTKQRGKVYRFVNERNVDGLSSADKRNYVLTHIDLIQSHNSQNRQQAKKDAKKKSQEGQNKKRNTGKKVAPLANAMVKTQAAQNTHSIVKPSVPDSWEDLAD